MEGRSHYQLFVTGCDNEKIVSILDYAKTSGVDISMGVSASIRTEAEGYHGPYKMMTSEVYFALIRGGTVKWDVAERYHHPLLWLSERLEGVTLELVESNYTYNRNRLYNNGKMYYHDTNTYYQFAKDVMGIDVTLLCKNYMEVCLSASN